MQCYDHHSRSLLAQFGLTPKSKRGLAAGKAGAVDVVGWSGTRQRVWGEFALLGLGIIRFVAVAFR